MTCHICSASVTPWGVATVLQKYQIQYFKCNHCGFIQTEKPYWLSEAYLETIARSDVGLIRRNIRVSNIAAVIISAFFNNAKSRFLDYGGGNGMFVRLMRDKGFDFFWQDRYTLNQFACGFESKFDDGYSLVTAFEVFEHFEDPLSEVQRLLSYSDNILFSTILVPGTCPRPGDWWYYSEETGQHISLYSKQSLKELAKKFNLKIYSNGRSIHLLTRKKLPGMLFFLFSIGQLAGLFWLFFALGKKSLQESDYFYLTGKKLK